MARRKLPIEKTLGWDIYQAYITHSVTTNTIPNPYSFWSKVFRTHNRRVSYGSFRHWFVRLQIEGLITVVDTGSVALTDLAVVRRKNATLGAALTKAGL